MKKSSRVFRKKPPMDMDGLSADLDIERAWKTYSVDQKDFGFFNDIATEAVVEHSLEALEANIKTQVGQSEGYSPQTAILCNVPKAGGMRRAKLLSITDHLVYSAIVYQLAPKILAEIFWSQGVIEFGHQPRASLSKKKWFLDHGIATKNWREKGLKYIEQGFECLVVTDLKTCYDLVSVNTLCCELRRIGCEEFPVRLLAKCLNCWNYQSGIGIPQGIQASHLLAKLIFNLIDLELTKAKITYTRYVDDFRFFCQTEREAKQILTMFDKMLKGLGLKRHKGKTLIFFGEECRKQFELPDLEEMADTLSKDEPKLDKDEPSLSLSEIQCKSSEAAKTVLEYLRQNPRHFASNHRVVKTILKVLGGNGDCSAVEDISLVLQKLPWLTKQMLEYLERVNMLDQSGSTLLSFAKKRRKIWDYQLYEIVSFLTEKDIELGVEWVSWLLRVCEDRGRSETLRIAAIRMLGCIGDSSIKQSLACLYSTQSFEQEQVNIILAIKTLDKQSRNRFYNAWGPASFLAKHAVNLSKSTG